MKLNEIYTYLNFYKQRQILQYKLSLFKIIYYKFLTLNQFNIFIYNEEQYIYISKNYNKL